jgi:hypothetical protein
MIDADMLFVLPPVKARPAVVYRLGIACIA